MDMAAYQEWLEEFDRKRGWHIAQPSHVMMRIMEELGEVARETQRLEHYRAPGDLEQARRNLAGELADTVTMLVKLGSLYGISLDEALHALQNKCEQRFSVPESRLETQRYLQAQQAAQQEREARYNDWLRDRPGAE
jgi:NTP pyrophosphatase (non-canonical NTP hydrolase)